MTRIAIIPARAGSQRIPGKNIRDFCGKPMIAWPIGESLAAGCFDHVLVSTDSPEIAKISESFGAIAPFERPVALADHHTPTAPVIRHALEWYTTHVGAIELACCIYPTTPLLDRLDVLRGLKLIEESDEADFAFSVTRYSSPIQRALRVDVRGRVGAIHPEYSMTRTQDLEPAYHDAGQFYWGRARAWMKEAPIFGSRSLAVVMAERRVQDIDTPEDWISAEVAFRIQREK
jgi:N-acylneuraminate cytidylyltransferase